MTAASGRGARIDTCPERHVLLLEAVTVMVMRLLLLVILFFLKMQVKALLV